MITHNSEELRVRKVIEVPTLETVTSGIKTRPDPVPFTALIWPKGEAQAQMPRG